MLYWVFHYRDGTAKLWHCGSGEVIDDLINLDSSTAINCCSINAPRNINLYKSMLPTQKTPACK